MSGFNGSGTFQISGAGLPYVSGTTISSAVVNQLNSDFATGLTNCITKDGQQVITANIGWNNHNINNLSALGIGTATPSGQMQVVSGATTNFIINSSGNVGIGTSSPSGKLDVAGSLGTVSIETNGSNINFSRADANYISAGSTNGFLIFRTNGANERMRIDSSGNVGIGTNSPEQLLNLYKGSATNTFLKINNTAGTTYLGTNADGTSELSASGATGICLFKTADVERMRIDSTGNVGIGYTSPAYKLDIQSTPLGTTTGNRSDILRTWSQAGSNYAKLAFMNLRNSSGTDWTTTGTRIQANVDNDWQGYIQFNGTGNTYGISFGTGSSGITDPNSVNERMRIDSSGNVGIGTTSPTIGKLVVGAGQFYINTNASSYCANINGQVLGNTIGANVKQLQIGETPAVGFPTQLTIDNYRYAAGTNGNAVTTKIQQTIYSGSTTANLGYIYFNPDASGYDGISFGAASTEVMRIISNTAYASPALLIGYTSSNGVYKLQVNSQIFATSSTIATSDGNYKENVNTLENALDLVCALNPVSFNWKEHTIHNFDRTSTTTGFIAQEVKEVLKDTAYVNAIVKTNTCVLEQEEKDEDGNVTKPAVTEEFLGIAEGNLIAILTKAIQELKTELDTVKLELAALKGL